jgi:hypothetical protein
VPSRAVNWLNTDERTLEHRLWGAWFGTVCTIRAEFSDLQEDDDPLFYNETASVGVLASAASRSGMVALAEYSSVKRSASRGRRHRTGRCDLWVQDPRSSRAWSFEMKQCFCSASSRELGLTTKLSQACRDADAVPAFQADRRFGGLIISGDGLKPLSAKAVVNIEAVARRATYACSLGKGKAEVWLIFDDVLRGQWKKT